jgi:hypothetical protein
MGPAFGVLWVGNEFFGYKNCVTIKKYLKLNENEPSIENIVLYQNMRLENNSRMKICRTKICKTSLIFFVFAFHF